MSTRAKFYVSGLTLLPGKGAGIKLNLSAVARGDRNSGWATATPSGSMEMYIQNPAAVEWWESFMNSSRSTGKQPELFIDIYPSTDGWPGDGHKFREAEGYEPDVYYHGKCGECGLDKDAKLFEYDPEQGRSVETGKAAHPNG